MIRKNTNLTQPTLFKRNEKEFLKEVDVDINNLQKWFKLGWLSFDPKIQNTFDDKEYHEVIFIKGLAKMNLTDEKISSMLSQLEKPYCYSYNDIYWDFNKSEWKEFSQTINKLIENNSEEIIAENLDIYLEHLSETGEKAELERIINFAQKLANEIPPTEEENNENFPWEDVIVCRDKKKSPETGEAALETRKRLEGTIDPCPNCGKRFDKMELFYFESPRETWQHLCGRAGWIVICSDCKKQIWFECEIMS